ncbi:MAG: hypothetical protein DCF24_08550 [Cyanobium sp.]|nr:MAG: hypothetical protein DCF24_08550 [Cyanobium sp.]
MPLLLHQHLRGVAGGCGAQSPLASAHYLGGFAGLRLPPLSLSKTQALLVQLLGIESRRVAIAAIRQCLSAALQQPMDQATAFARQQPVTYVDETGAPTGNVDGCNPTGKRGWHWVMVTAVETVFVQGLSR